VRHGTGVQLVWETDTLPGMVTVSYLDPTVDVGRARDALELDRRLAQIPASAQIRGFIFKMTADVVAKHGPATVATYRRLSPPKSRWFFKMYPVKDYLEDVAAGAIAINAADPHSVLRTIYRTMHQYAPLFNAQRILSLLRGHGTMEAFQHLEAQRDTFFNYGRWRMERRDDNYIVMHYFEDYLWPACHCGGAEGILDASNVQGTVDPEFDSLFDGRMHIRWQPR
jgi:uncharacterized protein (TIGR02265 family)